MFIIYDLHPTNKQKSFYGKAQVMKDTDAEYLTSYETPIIFKEDGKLYRLWNSWTATTGKHIKAYCGLNKKEFEELPTLDLTADELKSLKKALNNRGSF